MCIVLSGRPTICSEVSAPSIASVSMVWKFSLACRQVSLTAHHCRVGGLYRCLVKGAASDNLIGKRGVTAVESRLASIKPRLLSPSWSSRMLSGLRRNCLQCNWIFHQSAASAVLWRSLLTTPSFTACSCGCCASFLKVSFFASWMESTLS